MTTPISEFASMAAHKAITDALDAQVVLLGEAESELFRSSDDVLGVSVVALLEGIRSSSGALRLLAEQGHFRDVLVTARTIFETSVNACFILAEGDDGAERARLHTVQKAIRDLDREVKVGDRILRIATNAGLYFDGGEDAEKALEMFTTARGDELRQWTPESVPQRIARVSEVFDRRAATALHFGYAAIYRHASEISHGTVFGVVWERGLTQPGVSPLDQEAHQRHRDGNMSLALMMSGMAVMATNIALGETLETNIGMRAFDAWSAALREVLPRDA